WSRVSFRLSAVNLTISRRFLPPLWGRRARALWAVLTSDARSGILPPGTLYRSSCSPSRCGVHRSFLRSPLAGMFSQQAVRDRRCNPEGVDWDAVPRRASRAGLILRGALLLRGLTHLRRTLPRHVGVPEAVDRLCTPLALEIAKRALDRR